MIISLGYHVMPYAVLVGYRDISVNKKNNQAYVSLHPVNAGNR